MRTSIKTATRLSLAGTFISVLLLTTGPLLADPKATPGPTATPFKLHEKEGKFALEKEKIEATHSQGSGKKIPKKVTNNNASTKSARSALPTPTPSPTKRTDSKNN
jgi:hypothetical protein